MWGNFKIRNKRIFRNIYFKNSFMGKDSISGPGSNFKQTGFIITEIPKILGELKTKILLDIPCGDFFWMQNVDLKDIEYIGGDIVKELISINNEKFGNKNMKFCHLDLLNDPLPHADVLLCRDCLVHLSYKDIFIALRNIKKGPITFLLTTTFTNRKINNNIRTGQWRPLNLNLAPFNFPPALKTINEKCTENDGDYSDKSLSLWSINDLPDF
jgi:hypothetical protein